MTILLPKRLLFGKRKSKKSKLYFCGQKVK